MRWIALVVVCSACTGTDSEEVQDADLRPTEQVLWRNGSYHTWSFDNGASIDVVGESYSGVTLSSANETDGISGGLPSLEMTCSQAATCHMKFMLMNPHGNGTSDMSRWASGHLAFDVKWLDAGATNAQVILFSPLAVALSTEAVGGEWTAVSMALAPDLYGSDGPQGTQPAGAVFDLELTPSVEESNHPIALLNNIRWTAD